MTRRRGCGRVPMRLAGPSALVENNGQRSESQSQHAAHRRSHHPKHDAIIRNPERGMWRRLS